MGTQIEAVREQSAEVVAWDEYPGSLNSCLEAMLIAADQPIDAARIAEALGEEPARVEAGFEALQQEYDNNSSRPTGFELKRTAHGWQLMSRAVYGPLVALVLADGRSNGLSRAALEVLAIIAYKQPMTRGEVSAIRGVSSDGIIRSLLVRGLICEQGLDESTTAALLVTSQLFLDRMDIDTLEDLPPLAPFLPVPAEVLERELASL